MEEQLTKAIRNKSSEVVQLVKKKEELLRTEGLGKHTNPSPLSLIQINVFILWNNETKIRMYQPSVSLDSLIHDCMLFVDQMIKCCLFLFLIFVGLY